MTSVLCNLKSEEYNILYNKSFFQMIELTERARSMNKGRWVVKGKYNSDAKYFFLQLPLKWRPKIFFYWIQGYTPFWLWKFSNRFLEFASPLLWLRLLSLITLVSYFSTLGIYIIWSLIYNIICTWEYFVYPPFVRKVLFFMFIFFFFQR